MAIQFHCEHCGKKIVANDTAGGKWGKCPACHNKIYVPSPEPEPDEELKLTPIDESDEEKQKRLMAETYQLRQAILSEKDEQNAPDNASSPGYQIGGKELTKNIIVYLRQIANGDLAEAEQTAEAIIPWRDKAAEILDKISLSEMPEPELADIPQQVLSGLIRELRTKIR